MLTLFFPWNSLGKKALDYWQRFGSARLTKVAADGASRAARVAPIGGVPRNSTAKAVILRTCILKQHLIRAAAMQVAPALR